MSFYNLPLILTNYIYLVVKVRMTFIATNLYMTSVLC